MLRLLRLSRHPIHCTTFFVTFPTRVTTTPAFSHARGNREHQPAPLSSYTRLLLVFGASRTRVTTTPAFSHARGNREHQPAPLSSYTRLLLVFGASRTFAIFAQHSPETHRVECVGSDLRLRSFFPGCLTRSASRLTWLVPDAFARCVRWSLVSCFNIHHKSVRRPSQRAGLGLLVNPLWRRPDNKPDTKVGCPSG